MATNESADGVFTPPLTISRAEFLGQGSDRAFREAIYTTVLALESLLKCREIFGRVLGLTGSQFAVLMGAAYRQGEHGVSIRELAEHVRLAAPHVTTEVGRLIHRGLLTKRQDEVDRRSVLVSLSPDGKDAVRSIAPIVRRVNDLLFEGISAAELAIVEKLLRRLTLNADLIFAQVRRGDLIEERTGLGEALQA
ncbi:MarR family winged helix-turn-helix transcriptional regulator [Bosea sp. (in: a-proteobacteria)]|uniref:MarR family winged helix-turn-helix transcriptional regulator n=1 Tax=Bosea sp. (in: a-proteobacteria) TaxID=1871050 RepID=UPI002DDCB080|nr:MarR family transcriptional regulator [Bosea sp. (in: a-proteobacteria)]HEV2508425.1 MarR family transcriptional regulator [Bosea sp. (in: a-proteobacteria)]